jgi:hypothetical protein
VGQAVRPASTTQTPKDFEMFYRNILAVPFLFAFFVPAVGYSQVVVPANAITITFPEKRASFQIHNRGQQAVVIEVDLANRSNVHQTQDDELAILYPKTARLEPGGSQKISVTWRGNMDRSHYYLARIKTVEESALLKNRASEDDAPLQKLEMKVGQAFPIHFEATGTRPILKIDKNAGETSIVNTGLRGDHIEALYLSNNQLLPLRQFIGPGESIPVEGLAINGQTINNIKLRRFGWVNLGGQ